MTYAHTLRAASLRATSLLLSAALLGLAALAAVTMTFVVQRAIQSPSDGPIVDIYTPPPPAVPDDPPPRTPIRSNVEQTVTADPAPAPDDAAETTQTTQTAFAGEGPVLIDAPRWLQRPRDLARYYPPRAVAREMEGEAVLDCLVSTSGALACRVVSETPRNWGFGGAALRIAADYRMAPAMRDGVPVEGRYRMRVPFELN